MIKGVTVHVLVANCANAVRTFILVRELSQRPEMKKQELKTWPIGMQISRRVPGICSQISALYLFYGYQRR